MSEHRTIARIELLDDATDDDRDELIRRLDDGNDYPGMQVTSGDDGELIIVRDDF